MSRKLFVILAFSLASSPTEAQMVDDDVAESAVVPAASSRQSPDDDNAVLTGDESNLRDPSDPSQASSCAAGWTRVPGYGCYLYLHHEVSWANASVECQQQQAYLARLVEVDDAVEAEHISRGAGFSGLPSFWMGLSDMGRLGVFQWMHSRRPYDMSDYGGVNPWISSGEETKRRDFHTCGALVRMEDKSYKWSRFECQEERASILCEAVGPKPESKKKDEVDKSNLNKRVRVRFPPRRNRNRNRNRNRG